MADVTSTEYALQLLDIHTALHCTAVTIVLLYAAVMLNLCE